MMTKYQDKQAKINKVPFILTSQCLFEGSFLCVVLCVIDMLSGRSQELEPGFTTPQSANVWPLALLSSLHQA